MERLRQALLLCVIGPPFLAFAVFMGIVPAIAERDALPPYVEDGDLVL